MNRTRTKLAIGLTALATVSGAGTVSAAGQTVSTDHRPDRDRAAQGMSHGGMRHHMPMGRNHGGMMSSAEMTRVMARPETRKMHRAMTKVHRDSMGMDMASDMPTMQMR